MRGALQSVWTEQLLNVQHGAHLHIARPGQGNGSRRRGRRAIALPRWAHGAPDRKNKFAKRDEVNSSKGHL